MPIYDQQAECVAREELAQLQLERLQATLHRVYKNVKFYKKRFDALGFLPEDCLSLEDLARLPFTTRYDLAASYPYEMFAVPLREVVRIHSSTGSPGNPIVMGYTCRDLRTWAKLAARVLTAAGVDRDDVVQVTLAYGLMTSAFGLHYGVELLGASVIPTGPGGTVRQVQIMRDYRTTVLISTPGYARVIADALEELGVDPKTLHLKVGLLAGEPWTEAQRAEIEARLLLTAYDNYALSEAMGPGVAGECDHRQGMHLNEDHFYPEVVDPESGQPLPPGTEGELVITTLSTLAFPLLRFRTGDRTALDVSSCTCGRTLPRLTGIFGRVDAICSVGGIKVHPEHLRALLREALGGHLPPHSWQVAEEDGLEVLDIHLVLDETLFSDEVKALEGLCRTVRRHLQDHLGLNARIILKEMGSPES